MTARHPAKEQEAGLEDFTDFYKRNLGRVIAFLLYMDVDRLTAEEAAQEAFTQLAQNWSEIKSPKSWLRTVSFRYALRNRQRMSREIEVPSSLLSSDLDSSYEDTYMTEETQTVLAAIRLLPPQQRMIMALTLDGYTPTEISEEMGMLAETVRSNLRKARQNLKNRLFVSE
ncbi:sigma-70 family RNA polymerase sigma factor [Streptomyces sp. AS02]|uniref:sigma-70 family RNA polymerase sigma factor n=1 Tax=Streptomyces sp. AS02 TaxID=2938946 RepID=UPI0020225B5B|nr:sigma-70 family RNA polymerase sigma factor [Streptomyces sp. AS02]MCL8014633.1 sigma-70 family RNA polymerase sigma factor [Streptomyces sp. AS02]